MPFTEKDEFEKIFPDRVEETLQCVVGNPVFNVKGSINRRNMISTAESLLLDVTVLLSCKDKFHDVFKNFRSCLTWNMDCEQLASRIQNLSMDIFLGFVESRGHSEVTSCQFQQTFITTFGEDHSEYVQWTDLDLNTVLGDFTVNERDPLCSDSEYSDDCEDDTAQSKNPENQTACKGCKQPLYTYQCPQCDKLYRSVAGFCGHVSKKHTLHHVNGNYQLSTL